MNDQLLLQAAITAAIKGGNEILDVYRQEFNVEFKDDKSPLTEADRRAHKAICHVLEATGLPILSEEGKNIPFDTRKKWDTFWLVDPLDGTKEFVKRNDEFTVNIALVSAGVPIMGVILVPVSGMLYFASHATGAFRIIMEVNASADLQTLVAMAESLPAQKKLGTYTVVGSRSHMSPDTVDFIDKLRETENDLEFISIGSSLKICLVAEGKADIYPRFGPTMEWDTAAGHAILDISGGTMTLAESGEPMRYNKPDLLNPYFIASRKR